MKINIEILLDTIQEVNECDKNYRICVKHKPSWENETIDSYAKKKKEWDKKYTYCLNELDKATAKENVLAELLGIRRETKLRAQASCRALRKWYEKTRWERCVTDDMIKSLGDWIFEEKSGRHYDSPHRYRKETYIEFTNYYGMNL